MTRASLQQHCLEAMQIEKWVRRSVDAAELLAQDTCNGAAPAPAPADQDICGNQSQGYYLKDELSGKGLYFIVEADAISSEAEKTLLEAIMRARGGEVEPLGVSWQDAIVASEAVTLCLFGETLWRPYVASSDSMELLRQHLVLWQGHTLIISYSLQELLATPARKASLWHHMQQVMGDCATKVSSD